MRASARVRDALLDFYRAFSAEDGNDLAEVISRDAEGVMVIGTDPGDWVEDRQPWIAVRDAMKGTMWDGVRLVAGEDPRGYEDGSVGWARDRPQVVMRDGTAIPTRLTGVWTDEAGEWRVVHVHLSVGVPDQEVVELQRRWTQ